MPIERDAFYSMLGIAMRAGALTLGTDGVLKAISSKSAAFVLLDEAASENTKKKFRDSCAFYSVTLIELPEGELGRMTGKPGRMAAATADESFARSMINIYTLLSGVH